MPRTLRAPRGPELACKGWPQEAAMRMLMNNLDPEVAERPDDLIVYGGRGQAARDWDSLEQILKTLQELEGDETLLIQSGKPVAVFRTFTQAPRVIIANSLLVPAWATWDEFEALYAKGLTMFGQMTAGSWIYIGSQGIIQGTFETLGSFAKRFGGSLRGRLVVTAGLGGMGGAQPLAIRMLDGVALIAEIDESRIEKRRRSGYLDEVAGSIDDGIARALAARKNQQAVSIAVHCHANDLLARLIERGLTPDILTDQTAAHDPLHGYIPDGLSVPEANALRERDVKDYQAQAGSSVVRHVKALLTLKQRGAITFDYGNNIRRFAFEHGAEDAFEIQGYVPATIRELFAVGKGPFRWAALSGDPDDIHRLDDMILREFPENELMHRWITLARKHIQFQGLPARIAYLGMGERQRFGLIANEMVRRGELKAPIVIGRDHHDTGSVASPYRETERMKDGSDAIADWPILNALLNTCSGAHWVSVHHGGGVGIGFSLHAGMVIVADGTDEAAARLERALHNDPGIGVVRHADAGYETSLETARQHHIKMPKVGK